MKDGALTAAKEVGGAITSSTLTTIAVFGPLSFVPGIIGQVLCTVWHHGHRGACVFLDCIFDGCAIVSKVIFTADQTSRGERNIV